MAKKTIKPLYWGLLFFLLLSTVGGNSHAQLAAVGPVNLQNGYPLWWEDVTGLRVELCLDARCIPDPVQVGNPFSEQVGFGAEAFWWSATALPANPAGVAILVLAMEAAWLTETARDGDQFPFTRLRVTADVDVPGLWTITHPYGTFDVQVDAIVPGPEIRVSNDIAGTITDLPPFSGALNNAITTFISVDGVPRGPAPGSVFAGIGTIATQGTPNAVFSITGPGATITTDQFDVSGRVFELAAAPVPNTAPVANPDTFGVLFGSVNSILIDAVANDVDAIAAGTNERPINPKATGLGAAAPFVIGPAVFTTARGGQVVKNPDGKFTYTPSPTFVGDDTFTYAVQDTGGLIATALVTVTVEDMAVTEAVFRPKTGKWRIAGTTTDPTANTMTIRGGTGATGPVIGTVAVAADGRWVFEGKSRVSPGAQGLTITTSNGVSLTGFPIQLR